MVRPELHMIESLEGLKARVFGLDLSKAVGMQILLFHGSTLGEHLQV